MEPACIHRQPATLTRSSLQLLGGQPMLPFSFFKSRNLIQRFTCTKAIKPNKTQFRHQNKSAGNFTSHVRHMWHFNYDILDLNHLGLPSDSIHVFTRTYWLFYVPLKLATIVCVNRTWIISQASYHCRMSERADVPTLAGASIYCSNAFKFVRPLQSRQRGNMEREQLQICGFIVTRLWFRQLRRHWAWLMTRDRDMR